MKLQAEGFMDVAVFDVPYPYLCYRTANFVYEEGLVDGQWVSLYYNAAGYIAGSNEITRPFHMNQLDVPVPEAFDIVLDGQSINFDLVWEDTKIERSEEKITAHVILYHKKRNARIHIVTVLDGTCVLERTVGVENLSDKPAAISVFAPLTGGVMISGYKRGFNAMGAKLGDDVWKLGYFAGSTDQITEGDFRWCDINTERLVFNGKYRGKRFRHPMAVLQNKKSGQCMMIQLGWSGGYRFEFEYDQSWQTLQMGALSIWVGLESQAPMRVLEPGELWMGPEVHFGMVFGGLDTMINGMHRHIRKVMFPKLPERRELVTAGMGAEYCMDVAHTKAFIDYAEMIGAEMVFLDAGWYVRPGVEVNAEWDVWNQTVGEWQFHQERYPNGIGEIRDYCHERNMLFGLWMEPERIGNMCKLYEEHRDWLLINPNGKENSKGKLNLAIPECAEWVENEIIRIIEEAKLDFFRLDYNCPWPTYIGVMEKDGYNESTFVRMNQVLYGIFERLRKRFPDVIFENCASGGGRTDLGLMKYFYHTWVADFQQLPNAFKITNGMTMALPPECINRMVGGQHSYVSGDFTDAMRSILFTQMSVCHILSDEVDNYKTNPKHVEEIRHFVDLYKNFVRPMFPNCEIYHHTPEISGYPATGYGILELASEDGKKGMLGVFRLADPAEDERVIYLRGIDKSRKYKVTSDNSRCSYIMEGWQMVDEGIHVHLNAPITSELLTYEAID